jgi:cytochrome P450
MKIKPSIFNPIFINFPFLDHLPLKSRRQARQVTQHFRNELSATIENGHQHQHSADDDSSIGCRLIHAHETGALTDQQYQDNLVSLFIAGHENPQLLLTSLMFLLGENPVSILPAPSC